jgi:inner membrane protein
VGPVRVVPWVERKQVELVDPLGVKKTEIQVTEGTGCRCRRRWRWAAMLPSQREVGLFKVPVYSWNGQMKATSPQTTIR